MKKIIIVGAGAAGFFAAIAAARNANSSTEIILIEKSNKVLSKVLISGGGRCNVTHDCKSIAALSKGYPRGAKALKIAFQQFSVPETIAWFENLGIALKTEADGRMFPSSNTSSTIAEALQKEAERVGVNLKLRTQILDIQKKAEGFELTLSSETEGTTKISADRLIWATGGGTKLQHFELIQQLGHRIVPPVPSLFTFHIADASLHQLSGLSVENVLVNVQGGVLSPSDKNLQQEGALLITHFGLSGPAVLKLSAWGARLFFEKDYQFELKINFLPAFNEAQLREVLLQKQQAHLHKAIQNTAVFPAIPARLWCWIAQKADITQTLKWMDCSHKKFNKLINELCNLRLSVSGKSTFKEEFVTAGGIDLSEVDFETMESKICKNLFFAGEVLDIDGITGGYNFQAAWTTGYIAGTAAAKGLNML